ncbi:MAG: hypothetical protein IPK60_06360 [Sandaracinaceae bacterium]|nr:hypothetical protein [Sandaracinaceae bacterium]
MSDRLPAQEHVLEDGASIRMRPLVPEDARELERGFDQLSPQTRYRRFLHAFDHLKPAHLEYLSHIDGKRHLAWAAADNATDGGIAIARSIQEKDSADTSEYAITVVDAWQGRGVGKLITHALHKDAWANGVRFWRATMFADNIAVQAILLTCCDEVSRHTEEGGAIEILYRLRPPAE